MDRGFANRVFAWTVVTGAALCLLAACGRAAPEPPAPAAAPLAVPVGDVEPPQSGMGPGLGGFPSLPPPTTPEPIPEVAGPVGSLGVRVVDVEGHPVTEKMTVTAGGSAGYRMMFAPSEANLYRFERVKPGSYGVCVETDSCFCREVRVAVQAGETAEAVLRLDPGGAIEGVVVDEAGTPMPGAGVSVWPTGGQSHSARPVEMLGSGEGLADSDGRFAVRGLASMEFTVRASIDTDGFEARMLVPAITKSPAAGLRLVIVRLGNVSLRLLSPDGTPYTGEASAMACSPTFVTDRPGAIEGGGRIRITGLLEGASEIGVEVEGYAPIRRQFQAHLRENVDLGDVMLDVGVEVKGRVTDRAGRPVPGASLSTEGVSPADADAAGAFSMAHVPRGKVRFQVSAEDFLDSQHEIEVRPGMAPVVLALPRGAVVNVTLRGADGVPATDQTLFAILLGADGKPVPRADGVWDRATTSDDGRARFRLSPGRSRVSRTEGAGGEATDIALGEWTLVEGETKAVELTLPAR